MTFDIRRHEKWSDVERKLKTYSADLGYLVLQRESEDRQIARLVWTEDACAAHGHTLGNPADADIAARESESADAVSYRETVAEWVGRAVNGDAKPGERIAYRLRGYRSKAVEQLFSASFAVFLPAIMLAPASSAMGAEAALAAAAGDDDADDAPGDDDADDAPGGDADDDVEAPPPPPRRSRLRPQNGGGLPMKVKKGPEKRRAGKTSATVRAIQAAFASLGEEDDLNVELDLDGLGLDDEVDLADLDNASRFALLSRMHRSMAQHLIIAGYSSAQNLAAATRMTRLLSDALEAQTRTTLTLVDTVAELRLASAEQAAEAEKSAGQRATVERLGGAAIAQTGALLRARAVLDKVDRIDGDKAAAVALDGTGLENIVRSAAAGTGAATTAGANAGAAEGTGDAGAASTEKIEAAVAEQERVEGHPGKEGNADLIALLKEKPWIADGLRDPGILKALGTPEAIDRLKNIAPMVGAFVSTDPPPDQP
mgnify:CR=1 FL=1